MQPAAQGSKGRRFAPILRVLSLIVAGMCSVARAELPVLPTPPRQAESWTPPRTGLPKFLVSATAALFDQGLADPRGCEYRTIQVVAGSIWGGRGERGTTNGWILPESDAKKPRYAIAWSGLIYPLAASGGPADLDADVRALLDAYSEGRGKASAKVQSVQRRVGFIEFGTNNEGSAIAVNTLLPIKVCLLLRLGRADLAELVWVAGTGLPIRPKRVEATPKIDLNSYGVSYLSLGKDLAWYHFDRAICAHMRGDDALALADVRALASLTLAVDTKAEEMGFARPDRQVPAGQLVPYFEFLDQLPEFREDQERRARERANPPPPVRGEGPKARVEALIRNLDQVAARQWSQPGSVVLGQSPIVQNLIAEGDAAVEPLIRAFRFDDRLTRSVGFHRDFSRSRFILRADQAAYTALTGILKTTNFAPPDPNGAGNRAVNRDTLANQILAYWERNRTVPLVERWYQTLADDDAGNAAWLEAAGHIVQPENVRTVPGGGPFVMTETTPAKPGVPPRFRGESLREHPEPTVAALMARRVESIMKTPEGQRFELLDPCRMAGMFAEWDPAAAVPTLRELTRICRERYARPNSGHDWTNQNLAMSIARFCSARARGGDNGALREYAEWIRTTSPDWLDHNALTILEPLHQRPDDPSLAAAAAWLFGDPRSPWIPLIGRKGSTSGFHLAGLITSPLVEVPAFRTMLLAALDDRSPAGKAEVGDNGLVSVECDGHSTSRSEPKDDRDPPPRGVKVPIRACDFYAWQLATLEGAPSFNPCWPESRRDAALAEVVKFLKSKGSR